MATLTMEDMRQEMAQRVALIAELEDSYRDTGQGQPFDRSELERRVTQHIRSVTELGKATTAYRSRLQAQSRAANQFMAKIKDGRMAVVPERLFEEIDRYEETVFDHALTPVLTKQEKLDKLVNGLSQDRRHVINCLLDRISMHESERTRHLEQTVNRLTQDLNTSNERARELESRLSTERTRADGLRSELDAYRRETAAQMKGLAASKGETKVARNQVNKLKRDELQLSTEQLARSKLLKDVVARRDSLSVAFDVQKEQLERVAQVFAAQSGRATEDYEDWLPFVSAVMKTNCIAADAATPKPLELLRSLGDDGVEVYDDYSLSLTPSSIVNIALLLYGWALGGLCGDEPVYLLGLLQRRLAEDASAPVDAVLLVLQKYLEVVANAADAEYRAQVFFFGLWRTTSLILSRWPSAQGAARIRQELERRLADTPFVARLDAILQDPNAKEALRKASGSLSGDCLSCDDLGLVRLPQVPGWIFAIDFAERSFRMIHKTRGQWVGFNTYKVAAPEPARDLLIQCSSKADWAWILNHYEPRGR